MPVIEANFAVPIVKTFPSPVKGVHLFLNSLHDLSLYREISEEYEFENENENENEIRQCKAKKEGFKNKSKKTLVHVWSLGRFKKILNISWAPNGKLLAVLCANKCFIYSGEDGQKVGTMEAFPESLILWHLLADGSTLLLTLVDSITFRVKWSVNGEFELLTNKLSLQESDGPIKRIKFDTSTSSNLIVLQSLSSASASHSSQINLPFTKHHLFSDLARLSRNIQSFSRSLDDLKDHFAKLLKFYDFIVKKVTTSDADADAENHIIVMTSSLIKKLILFGGDVDIMNQIQIQSHVQAQIASFTEAELFEWKGKLKKQHAELLVQLQETLKVSTTFSQQFSSFSSSTNTTTSIETETTTKTEANIEKFSVEFLPKFEVEIKSIQRNLADFFIWIEPLVVSQKDSGRVVMHPVTPDSRALDLVKALFHTNPEDRGKNWIDSIDSLKQFLSTSFQNLISNLTNFNIITTTTKNLGLEDSENEETDNN